MPTSVLWRRLDVAGSDACRLHEVAGGGAILEGAAVFGHGGEAAALTYRVACGADFVTETATVRGWVGPREVALDIRRSRDGDWRIDGAPAAGFAGLADLDLGFTPATNTLAIRRLGLAVGARGDSVAVWLDDADFTLKPLPQTYTRVSAHAYDYHSPSHDFRARLVVGAAGLMVDYPGLWRAEQAAPGPDENMCNEG